MSLTHAPVGDTQLRLERRFSAAPAPLYDAHLEPALLTRWLGVRMPLQTCEVRPKTGGSFRYVWRHDGGEMGMGGRFVLLAPGARIVHSELFDEDWTGGEVRVDTRFHPLDDGTRLDMLLTYPTGEARDGVLQTGMLAGMEEGYQALEVLLNEGPICVSAHTSVSPERAWAAFTQPQSVMRWNFASPEWCCPAAESDLREGGRFSYRMAAVDGSMAFDFAGTWESVAPHSRLAQVLGDGRRVEIRFAESDGGTRVSQIFDPDGQAPRDMQRAGWQAILDRYAQVADQSAVHS